MSTLKQRFAELQAGKPDITQADLSRATGAKPPSVNAWFTGETKSMKPGTAAKAAALYGVDPLWLATGEGSMLPLADNPYNFLPEHQRPTTWALSFTDEITFIRSDDCTPAEKNRRIELARIAYRQGITSSKDVAPVAINLVNNPEFPAIRRVNIKLSAGASGFGVDYIEDDEAPIVFQRRWFERNGYIPALLMAVRVRNGSMEPGLYDGDTVVINTADNTPKDGEVFAVNYEGELVIKRMVRDAGQWWLASDNPDQRRYPRKVCGPEVFCLGRIVHKQSERI